MANDIVEETGESRSPVSSEYRVFESLKQPACIIGIDGIIKFGNSAFSRLLGTGEKNIRIDLSHPLFTEYRKRIAKAYLSALNGKDKQCFAVLNLPDGDQMPVEIFLFPFYKENEVSAILALFKMLDKHFLSFDRSTLSLISEDNFQYDNIHYEFSPVPIIRINSEFEILKFSHSFENFTGFTKEEIQNREKFSFAAIFAFSTELIKKSIANIFSGEIPYKRIGEIKIRTKDNEIRTTDLTIYPVIKNNKISELEIVIEDITKIIELRENINALNRDQLFKNIAKGFLHSLNNSINIIMSKTQLLVQITEKESVIDGIHLIENAANEIAEKTKRIENFIREQGKRDTKNTEQLFNIIEDAIEFSKMQFKAEDKEKRKNININKKYFSNVNVATNTKLLREIIISSILKVSQFIQSEGTIEITLKESNDLRLNIKVTKENSSQQSFHAAETIDLFSGINIRQVAEKINVKIIEEESAETYAIKAIFPSRIIIDNEKRELENIEFKLRGLNIMIVEDEEALKSILYEIFDKMGNKVFLAVRGDEALAEFKKNPCDLLLSDYDIEGLTGIELAARVKEINENTVTVLLSGWMISDIDAYRNVIDLFLPKPFKLDDLITEISKVYKASIKKK